MKEKEALLLFSIGRGEADVDENDDNHTYFGKYSHPNVSLLIFSAARANYMIAKIARSEKIAKCTSKFLSKNISFSSS